jgi:hypothetical protein
VSTRVLDGTAQEQRGVESSQSTRQWQQQCVGRPRPKCSQRHTWHEPTLHACGPQVPRCLGPRRPHRIASHRLAFTFTAPRHAAARAAPFTAGPATMAAIYRPVEAIALLRPSFLLPRIQPASARRARARAAHSSTPHPSTPPQPQRKSITLSGDTGQVRWSDLSPGEKAVRTTQQSVNLLVVAVGIIATASVSDCPHTAQKC